MFTTPPAASHPPFRRKRNQSSTYAKSNDWWKRPLPPRNSSRRNAAAWGLAIGVLTVGTIVKVAYFKYSRRVMVDYADRTHAEGVALLQQAEAYAQWSHANRTARVPSLTPEQARQMQHYLAIVQEHGVHETTVRAMMASSNSEGSKMLQQCVGKNCPI
jgi:Tfp pilus assembly protein PilE